jgi:CDP-diacylglycerol pyrophosphatase
VNPRRRGRIAAAGRKWIPRLALAATLAGCATHPSGSRDILWQIVSECLDPASPTYCSVCRAPVAGACALDTTCKRTTDVWAKTADYVAIRDIKMCGCPPEFIHGLALPRSRVTGVEDPRRPAGIWAFAWDVARSRIADEQQIALVVNPPGLQRTQDQLHVHLVRLAPDARARLVTLSPARARRLDQVWDVASRHAGGVEDYGVLVARDGLANGFLVLTAARSPEEQFTAARCR